MGREAMKRMGRPPSGAGKHGEPEKIRDYPRLSLTARPSVKAKLQAVATLQQRPAWKVVEDSIELYIDHMAPKDRGMVEAIARRARRK